MSTPSRRQVIAVAAATVSLPMLQTAVNRMRSASAAAPAATTASTATSTAPAAEKPGWFATTLKVADVKENEFTAVDGHAIVLANSNKKIIALTNKCTHKGCAVKPKAGANTITCPCHQGQFKLDGSVAKAPPTKPLAQYAIRISDKGLIEIDPGQTVAADDKSANIAAG